MNATRTSVERHPELTESAMSSSVDTAFEIDRQSGGTISNVGGDQTIYYGDRSRTTRAGRVLAALGLFLSLAAFALLVPLGVTTAHRVLDAVHAGELHGPYPHYVPGYWPVAAGLLVAGFVFRRFARIMVGR
jgi:hypothetical protein